MYSDLLFGKSVLLLCAHFCLNSCQGENLELILWPEAPRPKIQVEFYVENSDGFDERRALLKYEDLSFILDTGKQWNEATLVGRDFSAGLIDSGAESVSLYIAVFEGSEFLSDLRDADEWMSYLDGVRASKPGREITFTHFSEEGFRPPYILNSVSRQLDYVFLGENGSSMKVREIFAEIEGRLFVFVFSGIQSEIEKSRERHDTLLSRLDLKRGDGL